MSGSILRLLSVTIGLLAGLGAAQMTAATPRVLSSSVVPTSKAQLCAADENLLEIHVGTTNRGTFLTRLVGQEVWLDPSALRLEETAYVEAELRCGSSPYVRLLPSLSPMIDPERLTLSFQPAPQLLAGRSLTVEPIQPSAETTPLFSIDYAVAGTGSLDTSVSFRGAVRAHYINGPFSASLGAAADAVAGSVRWVPSAQVRLNVSPTSSVQLLYNAASLGGLSSAALSSSNASLFSGVRLQGSRTPLRLWPALTLELPFRAHLRIRVDGLLLAEYDVNAGSMTLRDLPLHNQRGRVEVEIRDEIGSRTIVQDYVFPGNPPGGYDLALDAGLLNHTPYLGTRGRYTLSPQVDVEASGRLVGTAVQAQLKTVIVPDETRSFSVGMVYDAQRRQPLSVVGSARLVAAPFSVTAFAALPVGDLTQAQLSTLLTYTGRNYDLQWEVSLAGAPAGLSSTLRGTLPVSSALTLRPAVTVRRDTLRIGLALDYQGDQHLSVKSSVDVGSGGTTGALTAQYRPNATTQLGFSANPGGAALNLQYADKVRVDAALDTRGRVNAAVQGSAFLLPNGIQLSQGDAHGAVVTIETGLPALQIFADGQFKGLTDTSGRLVFTVTPGRAVTIRVNADTLPFDITLDSDSRLLNLPSSGSYRLDWRNNFVRSRFVTFRWADGSVAVNSELRFKNAEIKYTDGLGIGFLVVTSQERQAILMSQDGTRSCVVRISAQSEVITCEAASP